MLLPNVQALLDQGQATSGCMATVRGGHIIVGRVDEAGADPRFGMTLLKATPIAYPSGGGELEQRQRVHPLRQERRVRQQPTRGPGALDALVTHLLQISLVYVNTLMIQPVLGEDRSANAMNPDDLRALSPLLYSHVNPHGVFNLDLSTRLPIDEAA